MNFWLLGVIVLEIGLIICGAVCVFARLGESLVAMEMSSAIGVFSVVLLAEGMGRPAWYDLALALAILSFPSGLVFLVLLRRLL
jgi:multicomponent Na+:H+ antiporter subunit F